MGGGGSGGAASLQYFDKLFHKRFVNESESRVRKQLHDTRFHKHKMNMEKHLVGKQMRRLKDIDEDNHKIYLKLSSVEAQVPRVVKNVSSIPSSRANKSITDMSRGTLFGTKAD